MRSWNHTFQDLGGDSFEAISVDVFSSLFAGSRIEKEGRSQKQPNTFILLCHFGEKGIFCCLLPVPISTLLVEGDMHQIDFTVPLFYRITDMSKVSMSSRPEPGYENMDHFSINVDHVAEMLRTIEFQTGESGWTETSCRCSPI